VKVGSIQLNGSEPSDGDVNSADNSVKTGQGNGNQLKLLKRAKKSNRKILEFDTNPSLADPSAAIASNGNRSSMFKQNALQLVKL
jgi:hypothetical protein